MISTNKILLIITLLISWSIYAQGQTDSLSEEFDAIMQEFSSSDETNENFSISPDFSAKFYGEHFFQYHFPVKSNNQNYNTIIKAPKWFNTLGIKIKKGNIELVSEWEFRGVMDSTGQWDRLSYIRIQENYLQWENDNLILSAGFRNYQWGVADEFNPTDNMDPQNYEMGFEIEDIPVLSASIKYYLNTSWSFQGVFIPYELSDYYFFNFRDEIPQQLFDQYQYVDYDLNTNQPQTAAVPGKKKVAIVNPDFSPGSSIAGIKSNFYSPNLDFSLSYIYDIDPFYTPELKLESYSIGLAEALTDKLYNQLPEGSATTIINRLSNNTTYRISKMDLIRNRLHRLGFDIKGIAGQYGIWLETCYTITEDKNNNNFKIRNDDLSWTAGLDFYYGPNDRHYANLQYIGKWIPNYDNSFYSDYPGGMPEAEQMDNASYMEEYYYRATVQPLGIQTEELSHGLVARLEWSFFNGTVKPAFNGVFTIPQGYDEKEKKRYGSLLIRPEIDIAPGRGLHLIAGANMAYAWYKDYETNTIKSDDHTDLIGFLNPYNNVFLKITFDWNHVFNDGTK